MSPPRLVFFAGGECLLRHGTWVRRTSPDEDRAFEDVSRSGSVGPYIDRDGVLRNAEADWPRPDWIDTDGDGILDTPTLLLEAARTNLLSDDDLTNWATSDTPTVTGSVDDPAGGTGAYTVEDDNASASELIRLPVTGFTDAQQGSVVWVVRENTPSGGEAIALEDATAGTTRLQLNITGWTNGSPTVTAATGTYLGKRYVGNGYWAIYGQTTAITEANTNRIQIIPGPGSGVGSIDVYRVNVFDSPVPSHSILDASEVRNADTFSCDFLAAPQAMTVYVKFIERGAAHSAAGTQLFNIGGPLSSDDPNFRVQIATADSPYGVAFDNGVAPAAASLSTQPSVGDPVEIMATLKADGSFRLDQSIDDGALEGVLFSSSRALPDAWAEPQLHLNNAQGSDRGLNSFRAVKVALGEQSMADMRAA